MILRTFACWQKGAVALYENDSVPLHHLEMTHDEQEAASAFDTIGTALYDLRKRIEEMQLSHLHETVQQSVDREPG